MQVHGELTVRQTAEGLAKAALDLNKKDDAEAFGRLLDEAIAKVNRENTEARNSNNE